MARAAKESAAPAPARDRIVDALMTLAAERRFEDISIADIASKAGVSLADFRDCFPSKGAVLAGFSRRIDRIVLDGTSDDLAGESDRDRLFDVLMRRLDAMAPYKAALAGIVDWTRRDPLSAAPLNQTMVNSMRFMLEAAALSAEGPLGAMKLQGMALAWARIVDTWLQDDDAGLSATMAELDRTLARGARLSARAEDVGRIVQPFAALARTLVLSGQRMAGRRRATREEDADA
ncbi:MAG: TetR/AcrR family transcriptional regulator [Hyphomicrobiales bacterium]|nr:TetR/AcrR family transcriptional regulator [Hyphomicrobiales bacterium]